MDVAFWESEKTQPWFFPPHNSFNRESRLAQPHQLSIWRSGFLYFRQPWTPVPIQVHFRNWLQYLERSKWPNVYIARIGLTTEEPENPHAIHNLFSILWSAYLQGLAKLVVSFVRMALSMADTWSRNPLLQWRIIHLILQPSDPIECPLCRPS